MASSATDLRKGPILALLCLAEFLIALDFSIVNVALPSIQHGLGFSPSSLQWAISSYAICFGGFLILFGRIGDLYGRRRLFMAGLLGFGLSCLLAGLSTSPGALVVLRGVQGLAASMIAPASLSLLITIFTDPVEQEKALGIWTAVLGAGFVTGVTVGGVLTQYLGWRLVFLVNVPVALLAFVLAGILLPANQARDHRQGLDVPGAVIITSAMIALVYWLSQANSWGWTSSTSLAVPALAIFLIFGFLAIESRSAFPITPLDVLRRRPVVLSNTINLLLMAAFSVMLFVLTLYLQHIRHL